MATSLDTPPIDMSPLTTSSGYLDRLDPTAAASVEGAVDEDDTLLVAGMGRCDDDDDDDALLGEDADIVFGLLWFSLDLSLAISGSSCSGRN